MDILKNFFASKPKAKQPKTVFIVEDNPAYARFLKNFLTHRFPSITECRIFPVGETCIMELGKEPDLIIMDYYLDSKYKDAENGVEAIREIRNHREDVAIILLSAKNNDQHLVAASKELNCYFIKKDEDAFYKIEAIYKSISSSRYLISAQILSSVVSFSSLRKGISRLSGRAFAFFD
jgi:CheY-like chemotaxis protein